MCNKISIITPEQIKKQKLLFNYELYGFLKFYLVISYCKNNKKNIFFSFYCKSEYYPEKVFLFYKDSMGLENRDAIKTGASSPVTLRGRRKSQLFYILEKFEKMKNYINEFMKYHPEMEYYDNLNIIWKLYKFDTNINSLISEPCVFYFNLDELFKNFLLDSKGVFIEPEPDEPELQSEFESESNLTLSEFESEIESEIESEFESEEELEELEEELKEELKEEEENYYEDIYQYFKERSIERDLEKEKNKEEFKKTILELKEQKKLTVELKKELEEKFLKVEPISPEIYHHFHLKFPHNGCRPKKVRRIKKSIRKSLQKNLT